MWLITILKIFKMEKSIQRRMLTGGPGGRGIVSNLLIANILSRFTK